MPKIIEECREKLLDLCDEHNLNLSENVAVSPLHPYDAIGKDADDDFVIKKGKETVIEAKFLDSSGQAFTDSPSKYSGTLGEVLDMPLSESKDRAIFIATMNALLRYFDIARGTLHCKDSAPTLCGVEIAKSIRECEGNRKIGLVGLQPAILNALVDAFGSKDVYVVDLNEEKIGTFVSGVEIWDGEKDLHKLVESCDLSLVTGSTIVNGTIDRIYEVFGTGGKRIIFYGNTISGGAALLGFNHICPFGR